MGALLATSMPMIPRQAALPLLGLAGLLAYRCARRLRELRAECARLAGALASAEEERERHMKLRFEERTGRTSAEKRLREQTRATASAARDSGSDAYHYTAIGHVASCYVERRGTPRQGCLVPGARAELKLSSRVPRAALEGLELFSHVWLVYDFHQNTNADKPSTQVKAKVHPPALGGAKIGLFATRTPHRPNAIGLTVARLLGVRGDTLLLGGADLVHGVPLVCNGSRPQAAGRAAGARAHPPAPSCMPGPIQAARARAVRAAVATCLGPQAVAQLAGTPLAQGTTDTAPPRPRLFRAARHAGARRQAVPAPRHPRGRDGARLVRAGDRGLAPARGPLRAARGRGARRRRAAAAAARPLAE